MGGSESLCLIGFNMPSFCLVWQAKHLDSQCEDELTKLQESVGKDGDEIELRGFDPPKIFSRAPLKTHLLLENAPI